MPIIRPSSDLRNNYNEISTICHQTKRPVYITKNGAGDLAVMSIELYELLTDVNVNSFCSFLAKKYVGFWQRIWRGGTPSILY